jgi:hypothetical protein
VRLLVRTHAAPVGVAVDHHRVVARGEPLLREGDELPEHLRIPRVDLVLARPRDLGEVRAWIDPLRRALPQAVDTWRSPPRATSHRRSIARSMKSTSSTPGSSSSARGPCPNSRIGPSALLSAAP